MTSKTDICNGALSLIGQEFITDFDTDISEEGDQCRVLYERSRRVLLTRQPWRFAQKTVALTQDVVAVNSLYTYSFQIPSDFLSMTFTDLDDMGEPYVIEGQKLLTNFSAVILTYTHDAVQEGLYSPGFYRTFEYLLASRMAYPLTKDKALAKEMLSTYEVVFAEEANVDSINGARNQTYIFDDFTTIRNLGA